MILSVFIVVVLALVIVSSLLWAAFKFGCYVSGKNCRFHKDSHYWVGYDHGFEDAGDR